jgi:hypothetical protein
MCIAERMFLRGHKNHFWILCHGIYTKDLGYCTNNDTNNDKTLPTYFFVI